MHCIGENGHAAGPESAENFDNGKSEIQKECDFDIFYRRMVMQDTMLMAIVMILMSVIMVAVFVVVRISQCLPAGKIASATISSPGGFYQ